MFRKGLIPVLLGHPMTVTELAGRLGESPRAVEDDLAHLLRSLRHSDHEAVVTPARCRKCGFVFGEEKLLKPGRCPECRSSWIEPARVEVRKRIG